MPTINRRCSPNPWSSHNQDRPTPQDKRYFSTAWKRARAAFIKRHPNCIECGNWANVVDHITPVRAGGEFWNAENWQPMCSKCHNAKSAAEQHEIRKNRGYDSWGNGL